jgi:pimeloyl-ACP methyl ester carboxylesterase
MRAIAGLAVLFVGSFAAADIERWGGMYSVPKVPDGSFLVFQVDTETNSAQITSLYLGLMPTALEADGDGWSGSIGGQAIHVQGTGKAGGDFKGEFQIGPLGPAPVSLAWMPPLRSTIGARAFNGDLKVPGMSLDITIRLGVVDGVDQAEIDIPLQGLEAHPMQVTNVSQATWTMVLDGPMPAELVLTETEAGLRGSFKQGPIGAMLDLKPVAIDTVAKRPQTPKEPFPYDDQEVLVQHPDGHSLAGTLSVPHGQGPFPVAILISGSGSQDRDESLMGHKPFQVLADHLSRNGIAVLRYDDRGVGGSVVGTSNLVDDTSLDFASDVARWVAFLKTQSTIDPKRIGLIGHSEGGLIAPIVAAQDPDHIAFIVLLSGPGVPGAEILPAQVEALLLAGGADPAQVAIVVDRQKELIRAVMDGAPRSELTRLIFAVHTAEMAMAEIATDEPLDEDIAKVALAQLDGHWMRWFMQADPADYLSKVKCPVLALNGTLDLQVLVDQNLSVIERVVREAGGDITVHRLEGLNHLFQPAITGSVDEYSRIETTFDPAAMDLISTWITTRMEQCK